MPYRSAIWSVGSVRTSIKSSEHSVVFLVIVNAFTLSGISNVLTNGTYELNILNLAGDHDFGRAVRPGLSYVDSVPRKSYYEMLQAYMKYLEVIKYISSKIL